MAEKHIVVQGATCKCNFGTAPDKLKVLTQSKRFANDKDGAKKLIATHKDIGSTLEKNTFGSCAKQNNNPCTATITEWSGQYDKVTLEDNSGNPLLEDSKATCPIGGKDCIIILKHGQMTEVSKQNFKNVNADVLAQINPLVSKKDMIKDKEDKPLNIKI